MPPPLSSQTRDDIVVVIARDDDIVRISTQYFVTERQMQKMKKNLRIYDSVMTSSLTRDRSLSIDQNMQTRLLEYIDLRSIAYLNEMIYFIYDTYDIVVNISTVARFLKRMS